MTGKKRGRSREARRAALKARQEAEREREHDELGLRLGPDDPMALLARAELEDEHFGGFRETEPGPGGGDDPGDRHKGASPYNRVWGRVDITVMRFGRQVAWQRVPRGWAAERTTNGLYPFILRPELEAYCKALPRHFDPGEGVPDVERDLRVPRCVPTSRALEERRFKKLPRIKNPRLFPRVPVDRAAMRTELEPLVAEYLAAGKLIETCPAETTTPMLNKRKPGRQIKGERKMTNAERQRNWYWRRREKAQLIKASPPAGGEQGHGHDIGKHQGHPRGLDSESHSDAKPKTAG